MSLSSSSLSFERQQRVHSEEEEQPQRTIFPTTQEEYYEQQRIKLLMDKHKIYYNAIETLNLMNENINNITIRFVVDELLQIQQQQQTQKKKDKTLKAVNLLWNHIGSGSHPASTNPTTNSSTITTNPNTSQNETIGCYSICKLLQCRSSSLQVLDLSGNKINDQDLQILSRGLSHNTTLQRFNLNGNCIGNPGCMEISNVLQTNHTLKELNLWNNPSITSTGAQYILTHVLENGNNTTVTYLDIDNNNSKDNTNEENEQWQEIYTKLSFYMALNICHREEMLKKRYSHITREEFFEQLIYFCTTVSQHYPPPVSTSTSILPNSTAFAGFFFSFLYNNNNTATTAYYHLSSIYYCLKLRPEMITNDMCEF